MTPERWQQIESVFLKAVEMNTDERRRFLEQQCAGDEELRREVEGLIASDNTEASVMATAVADAVKIHEGKKNPGRRIGPYQIVRELGRGGMGAVYHAIRTDGEFAQAVAIKLMRGGFNSEDFVKRFRNERQILARLDHPNIARLMDGGTSPEGEPYIVMELVEGVPISTYCAERNTSIKDRLKLFLMVCDAVQYAHQSLIVHRDLKPTNILVTADGVPKLLDFGIAKLLDADAFQETSPHTLTEFRMLTPDYASPEHVRGESVTTAADVYSLGTILYELLSGVKAHRFAGLNRSEVEKAICSIDPEPPSSAASRNADGPEKTWHRKLEGDLDNIILYALRKEPMRRYRSVDHFAEDIRRYLSDLPVHARKETLLYRGRKFIKRNQVQVVAAAIVLTSLMAGTAVAVHQARRAEHRFEQVRKLANAFIVDVDNQIRDLPGAMPARRTMVQIGQEYLEGLSKEARDDPRLEYEMAVAYVRIGDALGFSVRSNLGEFQAALDSYQKGLQMAQRSYERDKSPDVQRILARAHHRVAFQQRTLKSSARAFAETEAGLPLAEAAYQLEPDHPESVRVYSELLGIYGELLFAMQRVKDYQASWRRGFEVASRFAAEHHGEESLNLLANWHWRMSKLSADFETGVQHGRQSVDILETLVKNNPSNARLRRDLWNSYGQTGALMSDAKDLKEASEGAAMYRKSIGIAEELAQGDPLNIRAQSDLSISYTQFCSIISRWSLMEALEYCTKAERYIDEHPQLLRNSPDLFRNMMDLYRRMERPADVIATMRKRVAVLRKINTDSPAQEEFRNELKVAYLDLAGALRQHGEEEGARQNELAASKL